MRVNSQLFQPSDFFAKSGNSNARRMVDTQASGENRSQDRSNISPQGRLMSNLQRLSDQKKSIVERKRDLVERTMEAGGDMKAIQGQLDSYEAQLSELDELAAQLTADFASRMAEKNEAEVKKSDKKQTEEQVQTQRLSDLACATDKMQMAQTVSAVKDQVVGEAQVKEAEANLEYLEVNRLEAKGEDFNLEQVITRLKGSLTEQRGEASTLHALARNLDVTVSEQLHQAAEKATDEETPAVQEDEAEKNLPTNETVDTAKAAKPEAANDGV